MTLVVGFRLPGLFCRVVYELTRSASVHVLSDEEKRGPFRLAGSCWGRDETSHARRVMGRPSEQPSPKRCSHWRSQSVARDSQH